MNYIELSITTTHEASELVCDILSNYTDQGLSISDLRDIIDLEKMGKTWDYFDEKVLNMSAEVFVKGYIGLDELEKISQIEKDLENLRENCPFDVGSLQISRQEIDGDFWREEWKKNFKPIHLGKIVVVPGWIEYQTKDDEIAIILDSNMAFGTGEHQTTSMCIQYLEKYVKKSDTVLDVGCGSGILGITASKLGAKEVIMTDIDECAIQATEHNMQVNKVKNGKVLLKNLLDDQSVKGEVIVCNIMAEVLIFFSKHIKNNLKDKGYIILSGILVDRIDKVITAYEQNGFELIEKNIKGEWSALVMQKV